VISVSHRLIKAVNGDWELGSLYFSTHEPSLTSHFSCCKAHFQSLITNHQSLGEALSALISGIRIIRLPGGAHLGGVELFLLLTIDEINGR